MPKTTEQRLFSPYKNNLGPGLLLYPHGSVCRTGLPRSLDLELALAPVLRHWEKLTLFLRR